MKIKKSLPYYGTANFCKNVNYSSKFRGQLKIIFLFKKIINYLLETFAYNCPVNNLRVLYHKHRGVNIGNNVFIGLRCTLDHAHPTYIYIGNNVILSGDIYLIAHSRPSNYFRRKLPSYVAPIVIGDNTFIGVNTTILPGVSIGKGSVIAAGSVVFDSVPDNSVVKGNPAKVFAKFQ